MAYYFLGLGSNLGDRAQNISNAIGQIKKWVKPYTPITISPIYQTPAMLPELAPVDWNRPYLNLVLSATFEQTPHELLTLVKKIETELGRAFQQPKWSPRILDIDLLMCDQQKISSPELSLPHPELLQRAFVLDPLKDIAPQLKLNSQTVLQLARKQPQHAPVWMGILNITPDSFSDGDLWKNNLYCEQQLTEWEKNFVAIIDVGAESTRPQATPLTQAEEWQRLQPILEQIQQRYQGQILKPLISLDSYQPQTIRKALPYGIHVINDVSGLANLDVLNVLQETEAQYILTHSLDVPVNPQHTLPQDQDPLPVLFNWFEKKITLLIKNGIKPERIILDPGIGFGKNKLQSLEILRNFKRWNDWQFRILIGHSRKSFMSPFAAALPAERDWESVGISLHLISQGVDILRVHNPVNHIKAFQAWNHLN